MPCVQYSISAPPVTSTHNISQFPRATPCVRRPVSRTDSHKIPWPAAGQAPNAPFFTPQSRTHATPPACVRRCQCSRAHERPLDPAHSPTLRTARTPAATAELAPPSIAIRRHPIRPSASPQARPSHPRLPKFDSCHFLPCSSQSHAMIIPLSHI